MKPKKASKDNIIYVSDMIATIKSNIFKIIVLSLFFSILTLGYTLFTRDTYYISEATVEIYSKDYSKESTPFYKLRRFQRLAKDYSHLIKSDEVLLEVIENLNLNKSARQLSRVFNVSPEFDNLSLRLTLREKNSDLSVKIVNEIVAVSVNKSQDINLGEGLRVDTVAYKTEKVVASHLSQTFLIAMIFGLMVFTLITTIYYLFIKPEKIKKRVR